MVGHTPSRSRVSAAAGSASLLLVVLAAAGCGGDSDKQANDAYAKNVCTAIGSWGQEIKTIATSFNGTVTQSAVQAKLSDAEAATKKLANEIAAVPPPDTEDGRAAKQQLDQLSADVKSSVTAAENAVGQLQSDASVAEVTAALLPLVPQLKSLAESTGTAVTSLKDAGGSLASAFKDADACQSLGG